jgi:SulP family sulfate permease
MAFCFLDFIQFKVILRRLPQRAKIFMKIKNTYDDISLAVLWRGLKSYNWSFFQSDATAAISVALLSVPLSMAYALAAGLPPSVGLFATIFGAIFAAAFGSSRHLVVGPTNMIAILIQAGISEILYTYYRDSSGPERALLANQILIQLTLVVGVLQLMAGVFKLGRLTQFVSRSVVLGYIVGTALALIINQLYYFLGINSVTQPESLYEKGKFLLIHLRYIHWPTMLVGLGSVIVLLASERINKKFPASVLILALTSLIVSVFNLSPGADLLTQGMPGATVSKIVLIRDFGDIQTMFPNFEAPFFDMRVMNTLLPIAFAIALLGILESTSIARSIAAHTGQFLSINQEIFALGSANFISSLLGAMPSSGSFARSCLNYASGARTRFAAILSGIFVAGIVFVIRPVVMQIPLAALAALLLVSAVRMMNLKEVKLCIKATGSDALVFGATTLSCVLFNVDIAFYIGVFLSIVFYLRKASMPKLEECLVDEDGQLKVLIPGDEPSQRAIRVIHVEGELFFGAADLMQTTVKSIAQDPSVRVIVLHLANAHHLDATACVALQQLFKYLQGTGRYLIASGLTKQVWQVLSHSGLAHELGPDNLFLVDEQEPNQSTKHALKWAETVIKSNTALMYS